MQAPKIKPKVGQENQQPVRERLAYALSQKELYESRVHEWTAKIEKAKKELAYYEEEREKYSQQIPALRLQLADAEKRDREVALARMEELKAELSKLESTIAEDESLA